jgi:hypothetical protein
MRRRATVTARRQTAAGSGYARLRPRATERNATGCNTKQYFQRRVASGQKAKNMETQENRRQPPRPQTLFENLDWLVTLSERAGIAMVALFASYGPAWRAARLQPMDALRDE